MRKWPLVGIPAFIWLTVFLAAPLFVVVIYSFISRDEYGGLVWQFTLQNYVRALDPLYLNILMKSLRFAFTTTFMCLFFGYPLAYTMVRSSSRARTWLLFLIVVPFVTNFVVRAFALKGLLGMQGPLNSMLVAAGLVDEPISFLSSNGAILFGMLTNYIPFMVLPLYVAIEKFDFTLLEAARDLGASGPQMVWRILFPLTARGIYTGSMLVFIPALGEFVIPDIFGGGRSMFIGNLITDQFLKARDWPFGSALSMILFIILGIGITVQRRALTKAGAV